MEQTNLLATKIWAAWITEDMQENYPTEDLNYLRIPTLEEVSEADEAINGREVLHV